MKTKSSRILDRKVLEALGAKATRKAESRASSSHGYFECGEASEELLKPEKNLDNQRRRILQQQWSSWFTFLLNVFRASAGPFCIADGLNFDMD